MMDTKLRYYGRLRTAHHCGVLHGRDAYFVGGYSAHMASTDTGASHTDYRGPAIVRVSIGTTGQATPIFLGASHPDSDLDAVLAIEWSDSEAAARARAWVAEECTGRGQKLTRLASKMRGEPAEVSL